MPQVIERPCATCGETLDPLMASLGMSSHPGCLIPEHPPVRSVSFDDSATPNGFIPLPDVASDIRAEFTTMIRWFEEFSPRARQVSLGPSDLGGECDRQLAYKVAGIRGFNHGDPWPAAVGTAIHAYLENVIRKYAKEHGGAWLIENRVVVTPQIGGKADLARTGQVLDIKSMGKDILDKTRKEGPSRKYQTQIQLYGYGLNQSGYPIKEVAIVCVPRSGWLKDIHVWAAPYDPSVAEAALRRVYGLAERLREMDIMAHPELWEQIPAKPDFSCQWCSLFNKEMPPDDPATNKGCSGWNMQRGAKK